MAELVSVHVARLLKFALVGCSGSGLNLGLFFLLVDRGGMDPTVGAVACFVVAVTWNYFLNRAWTFRAQVKGERPSSGRYLRFVAVCLAGLGVNAAVLNLTLALFHPALKVFGQAAGIASAFAVNYLGANLFVFQERTPGTRPGTQRPEQRRPFSVDGPARCIFRKE